MLKKISPYALILFFLLAVLPKFISPINGLDAAWNYSNATNLSGDLFNSYTNNIVSNLYCYTQSFIAFGFPNQYGSLLFHSLVLLGFLLLIYGELGFSQRAFFLGLIVVSSYYFKLHRSEHVTLLIAIILYQACFKQYAAFTRILLISVVILMLHPVHGLLTFVGLLVYEQGIWKHKKQLALLSAFALVGLWGIHYFFPDNTYTHSLVHRMNHIGFAPFLTFLKHGALTWLALYVLTYKQWNTNMVLHYAALFITITVFGTANYYTFLFLPLILITIHRHEEQILKPVFIACVAITFIVNIVHPIYVQLENPSYGRTTHQIVANNADLSEDFELVRQPYKVFTENYFAPPLFTLPNARMMLVDKEQVLLVDSISQGDILLTYFKSKPAQIIAHLEVQSPQYTYEVIEVIPETPGYLTLTSFYQKRTESLGLWLIQVR